MAEITFARQFLAQLDARPTKLPSDWVADARKLPAHPPFLLPKPSTPFPAPSQPSISSENAASQPGSSSAASTTTVLLKPLRGEATQIPSVTPSSCSIYDIKASCSKRTGYAPDKIKILWERKPVPDSKLLLEVIGEAHAAKAQVELGVMFVGQPTLPTQSSSSQTQAAPPLAPVAQGPSGLEVIQSPQFWQDLEGFVLQRVKDEKTSKEAVELWRKASLAQGS